MDKICPLMSFQKVYENHRYCVEEQCAWWDKESKSCATIALVNVLWEGLQHEKS